MFNKKAGRQDVMVAIQPFDIDSFKDAAGTVVTDAMEAVELPQGAIVVGGGINVTTIFNGTSPTVDVGTDEGAADDLLDGTSVAALGETAFTFDLTKMQGQRNITMKLNVADATAGAGFMLVQYVVDGRSHSTQG